MLPIAIVFCGFIVFSNLSLEYNTVGTYQLFKGLTTPALVLISWQWYQTKYSKMVITSVAAVIVGVCTHSVNDIKLTLLGTVVAVMGVFSAALYQLWIGLKLEELNINPQQLLFYQAPLSAGLLIPCIIFYEKIPHYESSQEQKIAILIVIASAIIGLILNVTTYWVIKST
jgi:solute carrier family 35 protein E3